MAIQNIVYGDITALNNQLDIVIGMNTKLAEASAIGRRVLVHKGLTRALELGDVITFKFDETRNLHMLICHHIGVGGWMLADKYIRIGLDYLGRRTSFCKHFSIVRIGTGPVGIRDKADSVAIHTAMATSYTPLHLYLFERERAEARVARFPPLKALRTWSIANGEREIRVAAAA